MGYSSFFVIVVWGLGLSVGNSSFWVTVVEG